MSSPNPQIPLCLRCSRYRGSDISGFEYLAHTCEACPDGIPREVILGDPRVTPPNAQCRFTEA